MQPSAIIFDLDGTAIPNEPYGHPSKRLISAIKNAPASLKLIAATGRPITMGGYILEELCLTEPCVISGGTQIIDPVTHRVLWETAIAAKDVAAIMAVCHPYHYEIILEDELVGEGASASIRPANHSVRALAVVGAHPDDAQAIAAELADIKTITASLVTSWTAGHFDVDITPADGTKEHAINELLRMEGIDKAQVAGVGDGGNDIHLFKAVGYKVAMGNATPELKQAADLVIGSIAEDGLAAYIESVS